MDEMKEISSALENQQINALSAEDELALESELDLLLNSTVSETEDPVKTSAHVVEKERHREGVGSVIGANSCDGASSYVEQVVAKPVPVGMI